MGYPTLPGRAILYHTDGTVVKLVRTSTGVVHSFTGAEMEELNDYDFALQGPWGGPAWDYWLVFSFPEKRHLRGFYGYAEGDDSSGYIGRWSPIQSLQGSNDTTNGIDGTWTDADLGGGNYGSVLGSQPNFDAWRYPISAQWPNDGAFKVWRVAFDGVNVKYGIAIVHFYGHKAAGETPDDLLWVDPGTGAELTLPLDYGAVPAGSSSILQAALKNASTSLTAQNITISVSDPDDIIRIAWANTGPWDVSLTISSLAPGAQSAAIYVKAEPPAPPTPLKPHRAPIVASVGAWV